jgi:hypothetical protein
MYPRPTVRAAGTDSSRSQKLIEPGPHRVPNWTELATLTDMDLPIVCSLTESEFRDRRRTVLDSIFKNAIGTFEIANGYSYSFKASPVVLAQLATLVELERQCCQFLTFKIVVEPGRPITLEVTGPPQAKAVIREYFGSTEAST